jgi:hypothetical protein
MSENTVLFLYGDSRETTPTILASLPGTLQSIVNSFIAAAAQADRIAEAGAGRPGGAGPGSPGDSAAAQNSGSFEAMNARGFGGSSGMSGFGGMQQQNSGSNAHRMIQIKVDPAKLPRADDLKALMFPSTLAVVADDETIQFVSRDAFPDLSIGSAMTGVAPAVLMPAMVAASNRARAAREAKAAKDAKDPENQNRSGGGGGAFSPGGPGPG